MKIAFFVGFFPKLSETFILNQITGMLEQGHEVKIFSLSPSGETLVHDDVVKYGLIEKTSYLSFPQNRFIRLIKAIPLLVKGLIGKPKTALASLNIFKYGLEAASLSLFYGVMALPDSARYDVIHCHFGSIGRYALLLKKVGAIEGKIVTSFHGIDMTVYLREMGPHVYDALFREGDLFLPISNRWKKALIDLGCHEKKIIVHRMGIDTEYFCPLQSNHSKRAKLKLLTVSRLVEKKGITYALKAVAMLVGRGHEVEYIIVGDGPLRNELEREIESLGITDSVIMAGEKSREEVLALLGEANILLAPSITGENGDMEGIPVSLMEAMSSGLPVISTRHSAIDELVKEGESGFLVAEKDAAALADKIVILGQDRNLSIKMGLRGRKFVEENYNIKRLNLDLEKIFSRLFLKN